MFGQRGTNFVIEDDDDDDRLLGTGINDLVGQKLVLQVP
jgi:hypothetical protein